MQQQLQLQQQQQEAAATGPRADMLRIPGGTDPLHPPAEVASPISSLPPPDATANFDELTPAVAGNEEAEPGGVPGNRWPRKETLALLKIRSEMDVAFRGATFKSPLWEDVSKKLAEMGYKRSSKKCKEKFENVHKYYKRTKEGRAGQQDGKAYHFFSQLEAIHNRSGGGATTLSAAVSQPTPASFTASVVGSPAARIRPSPISAVGSLPIPTPARVVVELGPHGFSSSAAAANGINFPWNSSSSSTESDEEDTEEAGENQEGRKRKRSRSSRARRQLMNFSEGIMKQVMERQEAMEQKFLEAIKKREHERMIREEEWRRQEMALLSREQELLAQERAVAVSRNTAVISYLQKISGQSKPLPAATTTISAISTRPPTMLQSHAPSLPQPPPQPRQAQTPQEQKPPVPVQPLPHHHTQGTDIEQYQPLSEKQPPVPISSETDQGILGSGSFEPPSSSRWPKAEVHALIQLWTGLESRYQEAGPRVPLWEEISANMRRLGYSRSAKRCKEKWENINKYFKKVKDNSKQRPEDSKTCPYFYQLDAIYRKKLLGHGGRGGGDGDGRGSVGVQQQQEQDPKCSPVPQERADNVVHMQHQQQTPSEAKYKNGSDSNRNGGNSKQAQTSNGGHPPSFFEEGMNKKEDIVKDPIEQRQRQEIDNPDSENLDQDDDDESSKLQYTIQFQRQDVGGGGGNAQAAAAAAAATAGSFLSLVQ
ncbi:unnamed protein product [Musa hybrid cultivar]